MAFFGRVAWGQRKSSPNVSVMACWMVRSRLQRALIPGMKICRENIMSKRLFAEPILLSCVSDCMHSGDALAAWQGRHTCVLAA